MKKYNVCWNEVYCCQATVEAENEEEAIRIAIDENGPDQKTFGDTEDINAYEEDDEEDEDDGVDDAMDRIAWGNGSAVKGGPAI